MITKRNIFLAVCFVLLPVHSSAINYFVSITGSDKNPGTLDEPVRTLAKAFSFPQIDTVFILPGTYFEELILNGVSGDTKHPVVISAYKDSKVQFTGARILPGPWEKCDSFIYKTKVNTPPWQLFFEEEMLMPARWPNAFLKDGSVWDRETNWAKGNEAMSTNGIEVDDPTGSVDLANSGIDATGAMAILNVGSWKTWSRKITSHSAGSNTFYYEPVPSGYKTKNHYYYLEGTLPLLDVPGEWCYTDSTGEIFLRCPDDKNPAGHIYGKTQTYAMSFSACNYLVVIGIDFFSTTLSFDQCTNCRVEDCNFDYPSCSKRVLMDNSAPEVTSFTNSRSEVANNVFLNCTISNTESEAIYMQGSENRIENCSFRNIDWVVADRPGLMNSIYMVGNHNVFRRNTVHKCGASSTIFPGNMTLVEFNNVWNTGLLQSDGSITQVVIQGQPGTAIQFNWFHNTIKSGARFDAPIPPVNWGHGGNMNHNVVWETGSGLMIKGDHHYCYNNTAFGCTNNGIVVLDDSGDGGGGNVGTITRNNLSDKLSGDRKTWLSVPGIADHNWNGYQAGQSYKTQMVDPGNLDFRPRPGTELVDRGAPVDDHDLEFLGKAPDIGAYEFGDSIYWMGGRKLEKPSSPVPSDGSVSSSNILDLMWLEAYKAISHVIYFGTSYSAVASADQNSPEYKGTQAGNIYHPGRLSAGQTYYWRVDAKNSTGMDEKGDIWQFTTLTGANKRKDTLKFRIFQKDGDHVYPLPDAVISINGQYLISDVLGCSVYLSDSGYCDTLNFEVHANGFKTYSSVIDVCNDTLVQVILIPLKYEFVIHVIRDGSEEPLYNVQVDLNGEIHYTNPSGFAFFQVPPGSYTYHLSLLNYAASSGIFQITASDTVTVRMSKIYSCVKFILEKESVPVNNAQIIFDSLQIWSNSLGIAVFEEVTPNKEHNYHISKDNYQTVSGDFFVTSDTIVHVEMYPATTGLESLELKNMVIWPVPASDKVWVSGTLPRDILEIYNTMGMKIERIAASSRQTKINFFHMDKGIYYITVGRGKEHFKVFKIIIE